VLVDNIEVRQPSLDDVFFSLTGGHIEADVAGEGDGGGDGAAGGGGGAGAAGAGAGPVGSGEGRHEMEGVRA